MALEVGHHPGTTDLYRQISRTNSLFAEKSAMRDIPIPTTQKTMLEAFSWVEFPRLLLNANRLLEQPRGFGQRVMVLPGFGAGDLSTLPLRQYLTSIGYSVSGWEAGTNTGDVVEMIESMGDKVARTAAEDGEPIVLIGWSLGGYIAREIARDNPDAVKRVITMGSPVVGGPKYTRVASVFAARGIDLDDIERQVDARNEVPLEVPVTAIYSKQDGVVAWQACIDRESTGVEHIEVNTTHVGLGISSDVYSIIARKLGAH